MREIILNSEKKISNIDSMLSEKLTESWLWLDDTIKEMKELMADAKLNKSAEALNLRLDLIKHVQSLHWSSASKQNVNIWIFMHPLVWEKLNY